MNEMTLPSRHSIQYSSPGGLNTLPLGQGGWGETFLFLSNRRGRNSSEKGRGANNCTMARAPCVTKSVTGPVNISMQSHKHTKR